MKKYIYLSLAIILSIGLIILIYMNSGKDTQLTLYWYEAVNLNNGLLMILSAVDGVIITWLACAYYFDIIKEAQNKHLRTAEKASIKAEESTDKVKVLEAKIQTLEEALKKALKESK
jgi:hypothetical protein